MFYEKHNSRNQIMIFKIFYIPVLLFALLFIPNNLFSIIGVGADDTFILVKAWTSQCAKAQSKINTNLSSSNTISNLNEGEQSDAEHQSISNSKNRKKKVIDHKRKLSEEDLVRIVKATLKHSTLTISVTSITTSVAFFASFISNVTAIQCFR